MLKVGAVGCGGVGLHHQRGYQSHPEAELVCVCDMDRAKADARAELLGVRAYYAVADGRNTWYVSSEGGEITRGGANHSENGVVKVVERNGEFRVDEHFFMGG